MVVIEMEIQEVLVMRIEIREVVEEILDEVDFNFNNLTTIYL